MQHYCIVIIEEQMSNRVLKFLFFFLNKTNKCFTSCLFRNVNFLRGLGSESTCEQSEQFVNKFATLFYVEEKAKRK